jgi:hypothetical protein
MSTHRRPLAGGLIDCSLAGPTLESASNMHGLSRVIPSGRNETSGHGGGDDDDLFDLPTLGADGLDLSPVAMRRHDDALPLYGLGGLGGGGMPYRARGEHPISEVRRGPPDREFCGFPAFRTHPDGAGSRPAWAGAERSAWASRPPIARAPPAKPRPDAAPSGSRDPQKPRIVTPEEIQIRKFNEERARQRQQAQQQLAAPRQQPHQLTQVAAAESAQLKPCPLCARTFLAERIELHVRTCQLQRQVNGADAAGMPAPTANQAAISYDDEFALKLSELQGLLRRER